MTKLIRRGRPMPEYDVTTAEAAPALRLGDRIDFECPFCGSCDCNLRVRPNRDGEPFVFIGCFGKTCPIPRRMYLEALSDVLGIPGATKEQLYDALGERSYRNGCNGTLGVPLARRAEVIHRYRR